MRTCRGPRGQSWSQQGRPVFLVPRFCTSVPVSLRVNAFKPNCLLDTPHDGAFLTRSAGTPGQKRQLGVPEHSWGRGSCGFRRPSAGPQVREPHWKRPRSAFPAFLSSSPFLSQLCDWASDRVQVNARLRLGVWGDSPVCQHPDAMCGGTHPQGYCLLLKIQ